MTRNRIEDMTGQDRAGDRTKNMAGQHSANDRGHDRT